MSGSKHLEIFAVLPVGHLGREAVDLGILDVGVIIDELRPELSRKNGSSFSALTASRSDFGNSGALVS